MQCPKCGNTSIKPGQKFCTKCGYRFEATSESKNVEVSVCCPQCGKPAMKPGQKFCLACGTPLAAPQQSQEMGEKGLFRDAANFVRGAVQGGQRAVQRDHRRQEEERVRQDAERLGLEVNKPGSGDANAGVATQPNAQPQAPRRLTVDTESVEGVSVVNGRAIWNIEKGQLARVISEAELANADGLKGVIIQEGCSALVFVDGTLVANMEAGAYTFPAKSEAEIKLEEVQKELELEQKNLDEQQAALEAEQRKRDAEYARTFRSRGVFGEVAALGRGVMGFLFGHRKGDNPEQHMKKAEQRVQKIKAIPSPKVCRVYIVSNRAINMVFNSEVTDDEIKFVPFKVKTKLVDIDVAVTMQLQITNIIQFVTNYLADQKSVSTLWLQQMMAPMVQQTLAQMLRNFDYQQEGLPEPIVNNLKGRIQQALNDYLRGIEVTRVFDITDNSADFDRFRAVERELFATEKELGFLQRTNEFKNRLEQEQNKDVVNHASNEESLRQALQAINKDKLISEDEMDQFVMLLRAQKRLRDSKDLIDAAKIKEEEYEAISDLKKCHLVKDDEVAALENTLAQGKIDRENVTEIMRVQAMQKVDMARQIAEFELGDSRMEHDMANELRKAQHEGNLAAAQIETQKLRDMYNDERNEFEWNRDFSRRQQETEFEWQQRQREYELGRRDKFDDVDILERKATMARTNMQAMKEAELRELQEKNRSTETIELHRIDTEANMTQEQIAAAHMKDIAELDAAAQAEMAKMMGSGNAVKAEMMAQQKAEMKEMYEKMMAMQMQNQSGQQQQANMTQQQMMQMMQMMMQGMSQMGAAQAAGVQQMNQQQQDFMQQRFEDQRQRADEYREDAQRQQDRIDHTVDQSLNYTTQVTNGAPTAKGRFCPECGAEVPEDESFCGECGHRMN